MGWLFSIAIFIVALINGLSADGNAAVIASGLFAIAGAIAFKRN